MLLTLAVTGTDGARGVPAAVNLDVDNLIQFTAPGQNAAPDITVTNDAGALRFYGCPALTVVPECAAIQFFGNEANVLGGQLFLDAGATDTGAIILRTAPSGGAIAERLRVTAQGQVGIGTNNPQEQLELTGNLRLPTAGIVKLGADRFLHAFGSLNPFVGGMPGT